MSTSEPRFSPLLLAAASLPLILGIAVYAFLSTEAPQPRERVLPTAEVDRPSAVEMESPSWLATWHTPDWAGLEAKWAEERETVDAYRLTPWEEELLESYRSTRTAVAAAAYLDTEPPSERSIARFRQFVTDHYRRMGASSWRRLGWRVHDKFMEATLAYLDDVAATGSNPYFHASQVDRPAVANFHTAAGDFLLVANRYHFLGEGGELLVPQPVLTLFFWEWWTLQVGEDIPRDQFLRTDELRALRLWQLDNALEAPSEVRFQWWRDIEERAGAASDDPEPLVRATLLFQAGDLHNARRTINDWLERSPSDPRAREALDDLETRLRRSAAR